MADFQAKPCSPSVSSRLDGPRPDPSEGIFETTLVVDGRAVAVEAHLERLAASLEALYGQAPPPGAGDLIAQAAEGTSLGRLRLTVVPGGDAGATASVRVATVPAELVFPGPDGAVELDPVTVPGGIGPHKWADRRLLEQAEAAVSPALPLVVDADGAALETSRGSLFLVSGGALVTPPADGRLLPGITRAQTIELAAGLGLPVREEPVDLGALSSADEVFLTGAVRGVEPVKLGEVTGRISAELRRVWLG
jgi:para-aminobenzoate synthetase/4-amino-4-deoxychorismate lyase